MGAELAARMGLNTGDSITLYSITGLLSSSDEGNLNNYIVTGIFRSGYYEYDFSWAFINIDNTAFPENESDLKMGVKITNRFHDKYMLLQIQKKLADYEDIKLSSWREYNSSFFGALRTEKLFMFILVGLIFIVVGLNIFQAQRRSVLQRSDEIGLLRAVGGNEKAVQFVFIIDGAVIGFVGALIGLLIGLAIALNIQQVFSFVEYLVNSFLGILQTLLALLGMDFFMDFKVFSTKIFYIKETPSRIIPLEVLFIFMFGFLSALIAGWIASRKITKIQPAEVLRYE
jgi:lipoprotein-releasing system permease protein